MADAKVSVVIPAFNNWRLTAACIATLRSTTAPDMLADIIVVDDGSTDGASAAWAAEQRTCTPVILPANRGFSHACNAGAAQARGELLLFLNNDAFTRAGSVAALRASLAAQPTIGIAGARLLYADGSLQHAGLALLAGPVSRWWHVHRQLPASLADANVARDVLAVTGAALMIRQPLFAQLGGFDTGFLNGWEDVDLCLRAWHCGARVRYEPSATIEHLESATLGRTHDDGANERRFVGRWNATLATVPRYPLAEIPPIALALSPAIGDDWFERWAREHVQRTWGSRFGARVTPIRAGSRVDRARVELAAALAKRRPTLEVALGAAALAAPTGSKRAALVAPRSSEEAGLLAAAPAVDAWWTPTPAGRNALVEAGIAAAAIVVLPLGAAAVVSAGTRGGGTRTGPLVIAAPSAEAYLLRSLTVTIKPLESVLLPADSVPDFAGIDVVIMRHGGDGWGMLAAAALAHGCHVLSTPPIDPLLTATTGIVVLAQSQQADVVRAWCADVDAVRERAGQIALAAHRRLDPGLAVQRIAQTARALVHGTPSAAVVEVGPELAAHLRAATVEVGV